MKNKKSFNREVKAGTLVEIVLKKNRYFSFDQKNQRWVVDIGYTEGGTARRYEGKRPQEISVACAFYQGKEGIPRGEKRRDDPEWYAFESATGRHPMNVRTSDINRITVFDYTTAINYNFTH